MGVTLYYRLTFMQRKRYPLTKEYLDRFFEKYPTALSFCLMPVCDSLHLYSQYGLFAALREIHKELVETG